MLLSGVTFLSSPTFARFYLPLFICFTSHSVWVISSTARLFVTSDLARHLTICLCPTEVIKPLTELAELPKIKGLSVEPRCVALSVFSSSQPRTVAAVCWGELKTLSAAQTHPCTVASAAEEINTLSIAFHSLSMNNSGTMQTLAWPIQDIRPVCFGCSQTKCTESDEGRFRWQALLLWIFVQNWCFFFFFLY